jgi:hypothetical protein
MSLSQGLHFATVLLWPFLASLYKLHNSHSTSCGCLSTAERSSVTAGKFAFLSRRRLCEERRYFSAPVSLISAFRDASCNITFRIASSPLVALLCTASLRVNCWCACRRFVGSGVCRLSLCAVFAFLAKLLDKQSGGLAAAYVLTVCVL